MTTKYLVKLSVNLKTDRATRPIPVRVGIDKNLSTVLVPGSTTVNFEYEAEHESNLIVEIFDKQEQEAVIIEDVSFFGISHPKFAWAGIYEPVYPEPWASQQKNQGIVLKSHLSSHTYLGWNGQWTLTFTVPVFTWIHKTQNFGWIYS